MGQPQPETINEFSDVDMHEAQLNFERGIWMMHKAADERASGFDARLKEERRAAMERIDGLLDKMHFVEIDHCAD